MWEEVERFQAEDSVVIRYTVIDEVFVDTVVFGGARRQVENQRRYRLLDGTDVNPNRGPDEF